MSKQPSLVVYSDHLLCCAWAVSWAKPRYARTQRRWSTSVPTFLLAFPTAVFCCFRPPRSRAGLRDDLGHRVRAARGGGGWCVGRGPWCTPGACCCWGWSSRRGGHLQHDGQHAVPPGKGRHLCTAFIHALQCRQVRIAGSARRTPVPYIPYYAWRLSVLALQRPIRCAARYDMQHEHVVHHCRVCRATLKALGLMPLDGLDARTPKGKPAMSSRVRMSTGIAPPCRQT